MHVYLREERVRLRMGRVEAEGLAPEGAEDLLPMAFYAGENRRPSFRALLPPETIELLRNALREPVTLGLLAEEPEDRKGEVRAMVGLSVPVSGMQRMQPENESAEPWQTPAADAEAWRGDVHDGEAGEEIPRTALLAFAPLVRIERRFPLDFTDELIDLLEQALSGETRPALEARVDRMLGDL